MALPEGFRWDHRWQYSTCHDGLYIKGQIVAMLLDRLDGGWVVRLEAQIKDGAKPPVLRRCRTYETARLHAEAWARRHRVRLADEVSVIMANRPDHKVASGGWRRG